MKSIYVKTKFRSQRYEFIFSCAFRDDEENLFETFQEVLKRYEASRMFRDLKFRAAII